MYNLSVVLIVKCGTKNRFLPEQFTSLLLVVACLADSGVLIQLHESSEVKDVRGGKRIF